MGHRRPGPWRLGRRGSVGWWWRRRRRRGLRLLCSPDHGHVGHAAVAAELLRSGGADSGGVVLGGDGPAEPAVRRRQLRAPQARLPLGVLGCAVAADRVAGGAAARVRNAPQLRELRVVGARHRRPPGGLHHRPGADGDDQGGVQVVHGGQAPRGPHQVPVRPPGGAGGVRGLEAGARRASRADGHLPRVHHRRRPRDHQKGTVQGRPDAQRGARGVPDALQPAAAASAHLAALRHDQRRQAQELQHRRLLRSPPPRAQPQGRAQGDGVEGAEDLRPEQVQRAGAAVRRAEPVCGMHFYLQAHLPRPAHVALRLLLGALLSPVQGQTLHHLPGGRDRVQGYRADELAATAVEAAGAERHRRLRRLITDSTSQRRRAGGVSAGIGTGTVLFGFSGSAGRAHRG
mmetsp:Transcript_10625/g.25242  ORF Transcript_10625/g.25242 Transcript_10625/m.25242 type:complete len:402 (-) Transcript_10625:212-1417(-)